MNEKIYLIPIKEEFLKEHRIAHTAKSLYNYHSSNIHPEWFFKLQGKLFLDVNAYWNSAEPAKKEAMNTK